MLIRKNIFLTIYIVCLLISQDIIAATSSGVLKSDIEKIRNSRHSLQQMQAYMQANPELFPSQKEKSKRLTSRKQRQEIWKFWQGFLDRIVMLDLLGSKYDNSYKNVSKEDKPEMFRLSYATFLLQYRYAIDIISALENDPSMHTMLNEPVPELGLPKDTYKKLKFRFLNVVRAAEFTRLSTIYTYYGKDKYSKLTKGIDDDRARLWRLGLGDGTVQTLKNVLSIIQDSAFTVWFPLQASVSEWMGDVKVLRTDHLLISKDQISEIKKLLQPGDILLERREWYLSNIGLPGYWPHAALYIGSAEQRQKYFDENTVTDYYAIDGGFEAMLKKNHPDAYTLTLKKDHYGHLPMVIEAISEGVSFTSVEHSVDADSVVILRPNLSKLEKSRAINRGFFYSGRPYDFNFDFLTDSELVCTELIYKAYEQTDAIKGLKLPIKKILGRSVTTANDIAKMFNDEYNSADRQLEFIAFYDGHEQKGYAIKSDIDAFRNSWKRPKTFIWIQDTALEPNYNK